MGVVVWVEGRNRVPSPCWLTRLAHLASCRAMREPAESQSVSLCARACAHTRGTGEMLGGTCCSYGEPEFCSQHSCQTAHDCLEFQLQGI